jgi:hypothetical protein
MIRLALGWMELQMVGRIPNWPNADAVEVDMETGNTVLIWHDDGELKKINNARFAAANDKKFVLELAREGKGPDSLALKMRVWEMWLRNGMLSAGEAGKLE